MNNQIGYECGCGNCDFVSRNKARIVRKGMMNALKTINIKFKNEFNFGYQTQIVGSAKNNVIFQVGNSPFDTDIQLVIKGKKCDEALEKNLEKVKNIKFFLQEKLGNVGDSISVKQSTSVITVKDFLGNDKANFDIAICYMDWEDANKFEILKGKQKKEYRFDQIKKYNPQCDKKFIKNHKSKIKKEYLKLKCSNFNNTQNNKDDPEYKPSVALWLEACNNIYNNKVVK